eukprot:TRINITY_DN10427_c0_g1_i1.p1 TRINITY_DN10427_c0_g1~~TRINITY_DN10427_c0_g1_i1.p1  ORF type:complete len:617 (-),score=114.15 TRINITY_DN10427_c0_g1_i1:81-1931(-)
MLHAKSKDFRSIWSLGEGPQVESALYKFATNAPSESTTVSLNSWKEALEPFHKVGVDDQFMPPLVRVDSKRRPLGVVKKGDAIIYFDFRTDRAKPLTACFMGIPFGGQVGGLSKSAQSKRPAVTMVTMTHYDGNFVKKKSPTGSVLREAFNPAAPLSDSYAEVAGRNGIDQLVVAETEKWRAITWFKDGRRNLGYEMFSDDGFLRVDKHPTFPITVKVVRSRQVAAHIQAPQMRAKEITDVLLQGVKEGVTDIFANYANSDMVGHAMTSPNWFPGVIQAILELDTQLGRLVPVALKEGYTVIITADHGNAEHMLHNNGKANPAHTTNKVPFIILGLHSDEKVTMRTGVTISDLAPTVMALRGLPLPSSWDKRSALEGSFKTDKKRKIMKLVLDGYGISKPAKDNAMYMASQKKGTSLLIDSWMEGADGAVSTQAEASGELCGYPKGEAGTTEFGHVLFDAGRFVGSDVAMIDLAIQRNEFSQNKAFLTTFEEAVSSGSTVHVMGILSDGMVHSSLKHVQALLEMAAKSGLKQRQLAFHVITDGRDVPGDSSPKYITWLETQLTKYGVGSIVSIWGRGWGKDRDNRWKRIEAAFRSLVEGVGAVHVYMKAPKIKSKL